MPEARPYMTGMSTAFLTVGKRAGGTSLQDGESGKTLSEDMILIINGPNLNLTGKREPEIYGSETFEHYLERLRTSMPETRIEYFQSNSEGALIDRVQAAGADAGCEGIVINPGGYSHYSIALADALRAVATPAIEVHISNIHAREGYRATTVTGAACRGVIAGLGLDGYRLAVEALARKSQESRVKSQE